LLGDIFKHVSKMNGRLLDKLPLGIKMRNSTYHHEGNFKKTISEISKAKS